ncbi:MAG TPA: hypothetical protein VMH24_01500 [Candidatus Sulfotelmatobacter sp.]|nr:hypothetical protein [Candidatus Sulfotelmatobacter sp.]
MTHGRVRCTTASGPWPPIRTQQDPDDLRRLARTPSGSSYRADIERLVEGGSPGVRPTFNLRRAPAR